MNRSQTGGYVLKFISGKYQGGEFPLELDTEIEIGRGGELDMVLVEDMVSRRHARITTHGGDLFIEDFQSTNGTFVNGEKIEERAQLTEGDRILIGTNIIKLVHRDSGVDDANADMPDVAQSPGEGGNPGATQGQRTGTPPPSQNQRQQPPGAGAPAQAQATAEQSAATSPPPGRQAGASHNTMAAPAVNQTAGGGMGGSISGLIEEVPLPDLLQLFSTSRKSGVLVIMKGDDVGKVFLRDGRVYFSTINDDHDLDPYKAFYRLIAWDEGTFSLEPPSEESFEDEIDESVESLMMEGMRILDELKNIGPNAPDMSASVSVPKPLKAPLSDLEDDELDTFQRALNYTTVGDVLNKTDADDVETMETLVDLINNDYVVTDES